MPEQAPGRFCGPWREEPTLEQVCWQGLWTRGGPTLEQPVPEGLHLLGRAQDGAACGELSPMRETSLWGTARVVRSRPPENQSTAETTWEERTTTPIPCPLCCSGRGGRKKGVKLSLGRREGWGGRHFLRFGVISHYPTLIWLVIIGFFFLKFYLFCLWQ